MSKNSRKAAEKDRRCVLRMARSGYNSLASQRTVTNSAHFKSPSARG